jgi:16S rRNA (guanine(1405)-N(7))-methyltransferase
MSGDDQVEAVVAAVKGSKKYRDASEETVRELAVAALRQHKRPKKAVKAVRSQLHSIMAPYLGDPDYEVGLDKLTAAYASGDDATIKAICLELMGAHLSTRERLPILTEFYPRIFEVTGKPRSLLDVACGLNPLALPWMGLEPAIEYHAYDIHEPRIQFLNRFFALQGLLQLAKLQDVAVRFPQERADVALFLKEMPRFARNYRGLGRPLLDALDVRYLVVSFPTISTHGGRNLTGRYREFFYELIDGHSWPVTELLFEGELVFCAQKTEGDN